LRKLVEPNLNSESTEQLLEQLQNALREPQKYAAEIEQLLVQEAKKLFALITSEDELFSWGWNGDLSVCGSHLQQLEKCAERTVKLLAVVVHRGEAQTFSRIVKRTLEILAQPPKQPDSRIVRFYSNNEQLIEVIKIYPFMLAMYGVCTVAVECRKIEFVEALRTVRWKHSKQGSHRVYNSGVYALKQLLASHEVDKFFQATTQPTNRDRRAVLWTVKHTLANWLSSLVIDFEETWWQGEFVLGLCSLNIKVEWIERLPALYTHSPSSCQAIQALLTGEGNFLNKCFDDLEGLLQRFDVFGARAVDQGNFDEYRGFCRGALRTYQGQ
jgi:hypothetical protein